MSVYNNKSLPNWEAFSFLKSPQLKTELLYLFNQKLHKHRRQKTRNPANYSQNNSLDEVVLLDVYKNSDQSPKSGARLGRVIHMISINHPDRLQFGLPRSQFRLQRLNNLQRLL